jgi:hypothetical protein
MTSTWPPAFTLVFAQLIFSTLRMKVICSSETSVDTQRTTRRYIPEDSILLNHCCENLKSYILFLIIRKYDERGDWVHLARDRDQWRPLVNTVMDFLVS